MLIFQTKYIENMRCQEIAKTTGKQCKRPPTSDGRCFMHQPNQSERDRMYKKELAKLHDRVRSYSNKSSILSAEKDALEQQLKEATAKLELIKSFDKIKHQVLALDRSEKSCARIVQDIRHRRQLEEMFGCPFKKVKSRFFDMMDERNHICHPYTMDHIFKT
jgi:hypothetical protein